MPPQRHTKQQGHVLFASLPCARWSTSNAKPPSRKQGRRGDMSPRCAISLWQQGGGEQAQLELQTFPGPAATAPHPTSSSPALTPGTGRRPGEGIKEVVYSPPSLLL